MEQAPDRHAIASTTSRMDRPAVIDIRYSTLCSPVHNDSCSLLIAMLQLAPPTRGSLNTAARRATAVGSKTLSASTVKSRSRDEAEVPTAQTPRAAGSLPACLSVKPAGPPER